MISVSGKNWVERKVNKIQLKKLNKITSLMKFYQN